MEQTGIHHGAEGEPEPGTPNPPGFIQAVMKAARTTKKPRITGLLVDPFIDRYGDPQGTSERIIPM
jgi:hypothetical protein